MRVQIYSCANERMRKNQWRDQSRKLKCQLERYVALWDVRHCGMSSTAPIMPHRQSDRISRASDPPSTASRAASPG
jgi:hypothetical protein